MLAEIVRIKKEVKIIKRAKGNKKAAPEIFIAINYSNDKSLNVIIIKQRRQKPIKQKESFLHRLNKRKRLNRI